MQPLKTLLRDGQQNYIDVVGMRVLTNNRCVAEQIKSDEVTGGIDVGEFGKVGKRQNFEEHRDEWNQHWKRWNRRIPKKEEQHVISIGDVTGKGLP